MIVNPDGMLMSVAKKNEKCKKQQPAQN